MPDRIIGARNSLRCMRVAARGDRLWAFKIGGTLPQALPPAEPPTIQPGGVAGIVGGAGSRAPAGTLDQQADEKQAACRANVRGQRAKEPICNQIFCMTFDSRPLTFRLSILQQPAGPIFFVFPLRARRSGCCGSPGCLRDRRTRTLARCRSWSAESKTSMAESTLTDPER